MKRDQTFFYLLFVLLVMGAFAAMAQNSYGLKILGAVAVVFGLIFLSRLFSLVFNKAGNSITGFKEHTNKEKNSLYAIIEVASLTVLAFVFALRVFYIHFAYVEFLFLAAVVILIIIYTRKMILRYRKSILETPDLAWTVLVFHGSLILFLISLGLMPFKPAMAGWIGIAAFILLLGFIIVGFLIKQITVEGEAVSAFSILFKYTDYSFLIISLFFLFSVYEGFNSVGMLPPIYSDEFPQAYFKLVDEAAAGKEKEVDGHYSHQVFKENYDAFIKHNKIGKK